jgi:hypothetical protein
MPDSPSYDAVRFVHTGATETRDGQHIHHLIAVAPVEGCPFHWEPDQGEMDTFAARAFSRPPMPDSPDPREREESSVSATRNEIALREAIQFTAIPTLLVCAEDNAGVRAALVRLRAVLEPDAAMRRDDRWETHVETMIESIRRAAVG